MPERNGYYNGSEGQVNGGKGRLSRRRLLRLTGAGVIAGAAATGAASAAVDYPNTITFDGTVSNGRSSYEFAVSGRIDPEGEAGTREVKDTVDGSRASGAVHRDVDVYRFSGNLTHLDVKGNAQVSLEYGDEGDVDADRLEVVSAADEFDYTFTASDRIELVTGDGDNAAEQGNDEVFENEDGTWTVDGFTGNGYGDTYDFWGDPLHFEPLEGEYTLFLNGEEVSLAELTGQTVEEDHVFEVRSTDDTPAMYYEFTVGGEVTPQDSVEGHDAITRDGDVYRVEGQVGPNGRDSYHVPEKLQKWRAVDSDGNPVDESRFGLYWNGEEVALENVLVDDTTDKFSVRSTDDTPAMYYEFTVGDEVESHDSIEDHDDIYDEGDVYRVEGQVGPNGRDTYHVPEKLQSWHAVDKDGNHVEESRFGLYWNDREVSLDEVLVEQESHVFSVHSTDDTPGMYYEFTVGGEVRRLDDAENNDAITRDGDIYRVEGQVGPKGSDAFEVSGKLREWNAVDDDGEYVHESRFDLSWDGEDATLDDVLEGGLQTRRLEIVTADDADLYYTFDATHGIEMVTGDGDNAAESANDSVQENDDRTWTAKGRTGNGYGDAFDVTGDVLEFWPQEGEFALYLDGQQVTPWELVGADEPQEPETVDGGPVGGGYGYDDTVPPEAADYRVSTRSELGVALSKATSGDVVYVAGDARIDAGSSTFTVPRGVTLASNRGVNNAPGGLVSTDEETEMIDVSAGARVTGLRVQGPYYDYFDPSWYAVGTGLQVVGSDVEIDNCEVWGFAYAAVYTGPYDTHVHHNHVHHTPRDGLGYGVLQAGGHPLLEWNYFNYNRHAVASTGSGGYTVRYNHFGPDTIGHVIDMHRPGGGRMEIYNNTVEAVYAVNDGTQKPAVAVRGVPGDVATVYDNWFYNPDEPRNSPASWTTEAIIQVDVDSWRNVEWTNNHLGSDEPTHHIGCPRQ